MTRLVWWTWILLLAVAAPADAQLCRGGPSFAGHPYQLGGIARVSEGAQAYGGDIAVGGRSLFAGAGLSVRRADDGDGVGAEIASRVGLDVRASEARRIYFCPVGSVAFGTGPDIGGADVSTFRLGAGARAGVVVQETDALRIVPTFGVEAVRERRAMRVGGVETEETHGLGTAALGVGLILRDRFAVTPEVSVPFSAFDADVTFTVRVAYAFGE